MRYPVSEMFQTIQCEGYYTGTPSIFIRLQGCPIHCHWCDTKYTWKCSNKHEISPEQLMQKKTINATWSYIDTEDILLHIKKQKWTAQHIVITGGEPCIYDLLHLTKTLQKNGFKCQIETSGTQLIKCSVNSWVTVSPKIHKETLYSSILRSNEIKFPVCKKEDLYYLENILLQVQDKKKCLISLQPISQNKEALNICIQYCTLKNWRLSIQLHKYILIQ